MSRVVVPLVLVCAVLAGCGDDGPSDRDVAKRASLQLSDLPAGWVAGDTPDDGDGAADDGPCEASKLSERTRSARAAMPNFSKSGALVSGGVLAFPSAAEARAFFDAATDSRGRRCIAYSLKESLEPRAQSEGATVGDPSTAVLRAPAVADGASAYVIRLAVTQGGTPTRLEYGFATTRVDRFVTSIITFGTDDGVRDRALTAAGRRLEDAVRER